MDDPMLELQERLKRLLAAAVDGSEETCWHEAIAAVAACISRTFQVTEGEVAILLKTSDGQGLRFVHPPALAAGANVFPLQVWSFAGQVTKTGVASLNNAFTEMKHLSVYEHIKADGPKAGPIHKILAAPLKSEGGIFGVVEVSRKGTTQAEAGPNFTPTDLTALGGILDRISPFLRRLRPKRPWHPKPAGRIQE